MPLSCDLLKSYTLKDFIQILINYWKPIVGILFTIVGFIFALIKKKPVTDILSDIYTWCIEAVNDTEIYSNIDPNVKGQDKLNHAIAFVNKKLISKYPTLDYVKYYFLIEQIIERILATPHKKEFKFDDKKGE